MYSIVLATMLTAGSATPAWGHGCWGCHGCYGCGCFGNAFSCGGCWGCHGCYGNAFSCGCWGCAGCYGCGGCWGGLNCYGCSGCYGCFGCYGCAGGCYGCYGCAGGCYGSVVMGYGGYGCWGGISCHGCAGAPAAPAPAPEKEMEKENQAARLNQASVVVQLPEDARLYIDGQLADLASSTRTFITPTLESGRDYYYILKAEALRDGETISESKRVVVRAGQVSRVRFGDLSRTEGVTSQVTVNLPKDAKLFVDDVLCPLTSGTRSFDTPKLIPGRKYEYTLRVEMVRDGQTQTASQRVVLRAGEPVTVKFNDLGSLTTAQR